MLTTSCTGRPAHGAENPWRATTFRCRDDHVTLAPELPSAPVAHGIEEHGVTVGRDVWIDGLEGLNLGSKDIKMLKAHFIECEGGKGLRDISARAATFETAEDALAAICAVNATTFRGRVLEIDLHALR